MKLEPSHRLTTLPDFLIIGAAKSGTTSLYFYLRQHPDIFMPADIKEPGFFCFSGTSRPELPTDHPLPDMWKAAIFDEADYAALFKDATPGQLIGEATPEYLHLAHATIANIKKYYGNQSKDLKLIVILRNPIERVWSHYWMAVRDGYENLSFEKAIDGPTIAARLAQGWHPSYDYVGFGRYAEPLAEYMREFGRARMQVILFDDLRSDAAAVCRASFSHLGVNPSFSPDVSISYNASGQLRYPSVHRLLFLRESFWKSVARAVVPYEPLQRIKHRMLMWNSQRVPMPQDTRNQLEELYRTEVAMLSDLIKRDLSSWIRVTAD